MDKDPNKKSDSTENWLKNLAQESWQLELLVSAFTIFLLLAGRAEYSDFYQRLPFDYDLQSPISAIVYIFLWMVGLSISVLTFSLICHLLLRGFWIGTIGLRSVQDHVDWNKMHYSDYFTDKLKKKVRNLDDLVLFLDDICSVIFSFSFLLISIILAFGLTIVYGGILGVLFQSITNIISGFGATVFAILSNSLIFIYVITAIIYMIDFFSLGFFKKFKSISKFYFPFYSFFGYITLSAVSRSIYYHLISRFTKKKIRIVYLLIFAIGILFAAVNLDQNYYFSSGNSQFYLNSNHYDDIRNEENNLIVSASIPSMHFENNYLPLFIRYDPNDNLVIEAKCPDLELKDKSIWKWNFTLQANESNIEVQTSSSTDDQAKNKLDCLCSIYKVKLNGRYLNNLKFNFTDHVTTGQKGIVTVLSKDLFDKGENEIEIEKAIINNGQLSFGHYTVLRVWK